MHPVISIIRLSAEPLLFQVGLSAGCVIISFVMRNKIIGWLLCVLVAFGATESLSAQGTAFTYQGQLNNGGSPAGGNYDLRFAIYDAVANGNAVSFPLTNSAVTVTNGLFTTTLDFGMGIFTGASYWLEIAVRTNGTAGF